MSEAAAEKAARLERIDAAFARAIPYNAWLGLRAVDVGAKGEGRIVLTLPFRAELVGNPISGVLHGGPITAAMDAACGASVFLALREPQRIATLDLRVDYLRGAAPGVDLFCRAECVRITKQVAFARGTMDQGDADEPLAVVAATFMVFRDQGSVLAEGLKESKGGPSGDGDGGGA
ncbi:MAG: PaaI family thioesterase [Polyangiales bacterium]